MRKNKHTRDIDAIAHALRLPAVSPALNKRLNEAAKAGEQAAIKREANARKPASPDWDVVNRLEDWML